MTQQMTLRCRLVSPLVAGAFALAALGYNCCCYDDRPQRRNTFRDEKRECLVSCGRHHPSVSYIYTESWPFHRPNTMKQQLQRFLALVVLLAHIGCVMGAKSPPRACIVSDCG